MPCPITHYYFAKDVLKKTNKTIKNSIQKSQKTYELFAQGFDPFFTYGQIPTHEKLGDLCHQTDTDTYFLNFINIIKEEKLTTNSSVLACLYGHLTHYILDSTMHPFVIYKSGEYDKKNIETLPYRGCHHRMEMQIDAYLYETREKKNYKDFPVHQILSKEKLNKEIINVLNQNYEEVYHLKKGGVKYQKSMHLIYYGYKYLLEDKRGIKKKIYNQIDKLCKKSPLVFANLSTYIKDADTSIFNLEHKTWYNPWDKDIKSTKSFFDLYEDAITNCKVLFEKTDKYLQDKITIKEYKQILQDKSYVTGLSWHIKKKIKNIEF